MSIPHALLTSASKMILAAAIVCAPLFARPAQADSSFVDQIPGGLTSDQPLNLSTGGNQRMTVTPSIVPSPQFAAPSMSASNLASTIEVGNGNHVAQVQTGAGDASAVGIIGGNYNNVGVVQAGNNLQSNLLLIGTKGMSIGVLQPPGSAPVNMAIIHAPAGTIIIPH